MCANPRKRKEEIMDWHIMPIRFMCRWQDKID